ncbi:MAG TPA: SURF1 family protein [Steroidobacteraceae bacterium]|nr:SURF1 family protein [Steroidobacteraceae bacterium]
MSIEIAPMRLGSRRFAPRPLMTLLALLVVAAFVALGRWQLQRAAEKQALYDAFAAGNESTRVLTGATTPLPRFQHVVLTGRYDPAHQILIDNMSDAQGHAGYEVITPFVLEDGGLVLVNRGWVPVGPSRAARPRVAVSGEERTLHGRADRLPLPGLRLGQDPPLRAPYPVVANFPTHEAIERLLGEPRAHWTRGAELVLLDAADPDGYVRAWTAPGFPPMRHIAYAVQWFGLALALAVIYVVTNLRPSNGEPRGA